MDKDDKEPITEEEGIILDEEPDTEPVGSPVKDDVPYMGEPDTEDESITQDEEPYMVGTITEEEEEESPVQDEESHARERDIEEVSLMLDEEPDTGESITEEKVPVQYKEPYTGEPGTKKHPVQDDKPHIEEDEPPISAPPQPGRDWPIVVDATDHIAGRLATHVAKLLLTGNRVSIVNCERIMISGSRRNIISEYRKFLEISSILHPKHGPFHPRRPDTIMTRMIRGMLPRKKPSGRAAHKRLRTYIGTPHILKSFEVTQFEKAKITRPAANYTTMRELGETIGWTK